MKGVIYMAGIKCDQKRLERVCRREPFSADTKPIAELKFYGKDKWVLVTDKKTTYYEDGYYAWIDMQIATGLINPMGNK